MAFGDVVVNPASSVGNGVTGLTVNWGTAPTTGHLMLVWAGTGAADISLTNAGYTLLLDVNNTTESDRQKVFGKIATASEDAGVTTSHSSDESSLKIQTREGPWESLPDNLIDLQEAEARAASGTSLLIEPTGTTSQADELAVATIYVRTPANSFSWATGSFDEQFDVGTNFKSFSGATKVLTATQTPSTTPSWTGDSAINMGGMVTLKKEGAEGVTVNSVPLLMRNNRMRVA